MSAGNLSSPQMYRSRIRTEPTNVTAPQFAAALWTRLEAMFQEMADCCIKVRVPFQVYNELLISPKGLCFGEGVENEKGPYYPHCVS